MHAYFLFFSVFNGRVNIFLYLNLPNIYNKKYAKKLNIIFYRERIFSQSFITSIIMVMDINKRIDILQQIVDRIGTGLES